MKFITIENRSSWLIKEIPNFHPDDPRHTLLWRDYKKKCIEGLWGKDFDGYRFMPGNLFFYINFCIILHAEKKKKARYRIKPSLRDLEWERAYACLESFGFSGFSDDEYVSCNSFLHPKVIGTLSEKDKKDLPKECFKGDGTLKQYENPRDYLRKLHSQPLGKPLYHNNASNTIEMGSRGGGKMTPLYTPVLTTKGWKKMGDLTINDKVYGRNGKEASIKGIYPQGNKQIWLLKLQDGREIECGDEHLWTVRKQSGKEVVISTKEMFESGLTYNAQKGNLYKYQIPNCKEIEFEEKQLPIDPYILGCLLGDGTMTTLTPKIASSDEFIINEFKRLLPDFEIKHDEATTNNYTIVDKNKEKSLINNRWNQQHLAKVKNRLTTKIIELNLNKNCSEKFIPEIYKQGSVQQRINLLQGLIDTDGSVTSDGHIEFTNTNLQLINDTADICRSLGIRCTINEDNREGQKHNIKGHLCVRKKYYRLYINTTKEIARLPRKRERITNKKYQIRHDFISIVDIQPLDKYTEQQCISVDNKDNTYITKDYIVTHNSYWYALGVNLHEIVFDGAKEYTEETRKNPAKTEVLIGAALTSKSNEFCDKIKFAMTELATNVELGCWGKPGDEDYQPSPFYKDMKGSLEPNNAKNPYRHEYEKKVNGRWIGGFGSGSKILHVSFTTDNPEAAAGTRPARITVEELGLVPNILTVHGSNDACQIVDSTKFGSTHYLGTAGNIDKIVEARILFTEPRGYNILAYNDIWEHTGEIGFFLPAYYINNDFKDENGNTDVEKAKAFYEKRRANAKKVSSQAYDAELMNFPLVPSEMFLGREGKILPVTELKEVEKSLLLHNNYKKRGTAIDIYFDSSKKTGVDYKVLENVEPIYEYPAKRDSNVEGCIMMYEAPIEINGEVPNDMYDLVGFDPYVSENLEDGESLGSVYVMKNPKYSALGYGGNEIVCGYTGKHSLGRTRFLENVEKILMMYGSPLQGLWFEGNRGDYVKGYFEKKHKLHQLCLRPQIEKGVRILKRPVAEYGWITGNRLSKVQLIDMLAEWLKEETLVNGVTKRNLERLPDIALVRELIAFDLDKGNFDRCFKEDVRILTNEGLKLIKDINVNDKVLTKSGEYNPVIIKHKNKAKLFNVYIQGQDKPIETTENHPFYSKWNNTVKHNTRIKLLQEGYVEAKNLTTNNFVLLPKRKLTNKYYSNEELYLLGWYLGDGYSSEKSNTLKIRFGIHELEQANNLLKIVNNICNFKKGRIELDKRSNCYNLIKTSKTIKQFLWDNIGGPNNKKLNDKIFNSQNNFYFILGFIEAEGHKTKNKGSIQVSNTNLSAMYSLRQMLLDNGIYNTISKVKRKENSLQQLRIDIPYTHVEKFKISSKFNFEPSYKRQRIKLNVIEKEEGFYCKVIKIELTNLETDTYNLSVLNDNTYFANEVLVHNCMALVGCIVGLREKINQYEAQVINRNNPLSLLANNDSLFNRQNQKVKKRRALLEGSFTKSMLL